MEAPRRGLRGAVGQNPSNPASSRTCSAYRARQQIAEIKPGCGRPPHAGIQNRLEVAGQIENGCGRYALEHREKASPPTSTHARSPGKKGCEEL